MNTAIDAAWINANGVVIGVALSIAQIIFAITVPIGIELWNRKHRAMTTPSDMNPQALTTSNEKNSSKVWFLKNAWGALLGLPLSVWLMFWQVSQPGPPTREFVGVMVFLGLYFALNLVAVVGFAFAAALRPMSQRYEAFLAKHDSKPD